MRETTLLNTGWTYVKSASDANAAATATGQPITLPYTWNAIDGQDGGNDYYRGRCWYVRELELAPPADGEEIWLQLDGAAMIADVYLNGEPLAHHEGGYSTFRVNLTPQLKAENTLAVAVDNSENDRVYPQKADFTFYGGLYRNVSLLRLPAAHFALAGGATGLKITPVVAENLKTAVITLQAETEQAEGATVQFAVAGQRAEAVVHDGIATAGITLDPVHLWDGVKDPYLYTATATLTGGDEITARFGCRRFEITPDKGFFLNGRAYPLRGVSRHQDRKGLGNALRMAEHQEDISIIREIGATTVRLAHYQQAQEFYSLCDEAGLIVWAEIPYITLHMPNGRENTLSQMKELVTQSYNHPSIVCWGLSNEITASGPVNEDMLENHRQLNDLCHALDTTRPTAMADVFMLEIDSPILAIPDVNSYNLYFGWYLGELEQNDSFFDDFHKAYPKMPMGFSEYGADANPAYQSAAPERGDYTEGYQCIYHEHILRMIETRPWLWATHVWNLFDFGADGRDEGGKHGENQKGLVSFDRKLKKDAFYLYKAWWSDEPFVHLCGSRYIDRAGAETEITVYSNQDTVTLMVDGQAFATKACTHSVTFRVPITATHHIEARSGSLTDAITVRHVETENPDYCYGTPGGVMNWFDKEDFKRGYFSIQDTLGELGATPESAKLLAALMAKAGASRGDVAKSTSGNANLSRMMAGTKLQSVLKSVGDSITPEEIKALNAALQTIKKPD